jgi:hypothetical protein
MEKTANTTLERGKKESILTKILKSQTDFGFKPKRDFYSAIGINQKRFGMLCRNELPVNYEELNSICAYFKVNLRDFI